MFKTILKRLKFIIGGGEKKFRIRKLGPGKYQVQMKGGGAGPFWGIANFSTFVTYDEAAYWKGRWEQQAKNG